MSNWPLVRAGATVTPTIIAEYPGIMVTASATPHALGPWVEVTPGLPWPADAIELSLNSFGGDDAWTALVNIGIGAAGSETVIAPAILFGAWAFRNTHGVVPIPVRIPAGVRVAVQIRASLASLSRLVGVRFHGATGLFPVGGRITAHGTNDATSSGIAMGTTYGGDTITELVASAPAAVRALIVRAVPASASQADCVMRLWIGPGGSETLLSDYLPTFQPAGTIALPVNLPAGTRIGASLRMLNISNVAAMAAYLVH